ncbi:4Fe-4S dicluster domain-containing protein [Kosakonia sp. R1.Fl]|uniref:4Fe-4S dicluster domain-containing protein n=1 Tax=Kosakonia sp. R1.Fl TaxID=2928706 RepID=UPI00201DF303|nr:4Fe-4S dicluster domain-containing protein [Kosakonia sp. R1.Fl]MCL6744611.1 4Fe-4S dicluster domain-containing protein [Kosakonia sp. R1.Fl]
MNRFVIADPEWCIGCNTCLAACSDVHKSQGLQHHPRLTLVRTPSKTAPILCRHCDDAPCKQVCPVNAISFRDDAVYLNETLCIGCKLCGLVCPFGAITPAGSRPLNIPARYEHHIAEEQLRDVPGSAPNDHPFLRWNAGVQTIAVKCDLCDFLPEGPACVRACPTQALHLETENTLHKQLKARRELAALSSTDVTFPPLPSSPEQR